MSAFVAGDISLLVATTVIEVGVDVPQATLMVVEQAERFGLAQLHQLRGRVGRGGGRSVCLLLRAPEISETARERLTLIRATNDGFEIAGKGSRPARRRRTSRYETVGRSGAPRSDGGGRHASRGTGARRCAAFSRA